MATPAPGTPQATQSQPTETTPAQNAAAHSKTEKVWVGVRVRPLLRHEIDAKETVAWRAANLTTLSCLAEEKNVYQPSSYQYDRVFGDSCSSEEVYAAAAKPMVRSAMRGYNCTLFAYGQTGSGKTTTMRSVMQHAAKDIFEHIAQAQDRDFVLRMCAIEVYNEVVHDLFVDTDTSLKINDDKEKGIVVVDLTEQSIESEEHLMKMLKAVEGRRQVRETKMNQKSSRSHMVVRLYVESRPAAVASDDEDDLASDDSSNNGDAATLATEDSAQSLAPVLSTINFVDLAGSERLSQASMTDDATAEKLRTKEASNINVSLLTLGKVIRALGKRGEHVPYRESNLTRILQPSLSGNSRMAIVCTLSPALGSVENSRAALHFANHAKAVTMRPVLNEVRGEQAIIHKMEVEITELRRRLARIDRTDRGTRTGTKQLLAEKDAEIKAKEEQMRQALQERAALERRLNQMEKFIIRGGSGSPAPGVRRSFDGLESLTTSLAAGAMGASGHPARGVAGQVAASGVGVRASWTPSNPSPLDGRERQSAGKTAGRYGFGLGSTPSRSVGNPNRLLLDYLLPPNVRDAVNKLGGEVSLRPAASPMAGAAGLGTEAAAAIYTSAFNLRMEIGKLQGPEGSKAQEALSALRAEVRCFSQQPDAAAAVAAAAGATPDTADRLLQQLTEMLSNMEQRHREGPAGEARGEAASDGGATAAAPAGRSSGSGGGAAAQQKGEAGQQQKAQGEQEKQAPTPDEEAGLIALLRNEVARLQRLRAINVQTNQAIESLLGKMAEFEQAGVSGSTGQLDGMLQVPGVLERLHAALQEADALEEGEEEEGVEADAAGQDGAAVGAARTPLRRRSAAADDGEATSAPRYDSPAASARAAAAATTTAGPSPTRLAGTKLPRAVLEEDEEEDEDGCVGLVKSPRRGLLASPHTAAASLPKKAAGTPNSRMQQQPSASAGGAGVQVHHHRAKGPPIPRQPSDSPRALAEGEEGLALRRMRTPSISLHASDGEPPSGGRRTASASSRGALLRWDTERAKRIISREKDAIHSWYATEVSRLQAAFRAKAQADVDAMREAMERYRGMFEETQERVERLNLQKQLLIKQVLQLELTADEAEQEQARSNALIAKLTAERDQARYEAAQAQSRAQAAHLQAQRAQALAAQNAVPVQQQPSTSSEQHAFYDEDDDWADAPTSETLLAQICELWHKLHVPLVYRSRFFLLFRSKELIYLQMEQRRLKHRREQIDKEIEGDYLGRSKPLEKAKRALDLERKVLAQAVRFAYNDRDRENLYAAWDVRGPKGRKLQLLKKIWEPAYTRDQDGMEACAKVVCSLAGPDATEQFMQLVFGNTAEVCARPTHVGALVSTLVRRVTTPRQRKAASPTVAGGAAPTTATTTTTMAGGAGPLASSQATTAGYYLNAAAAPSPGTGGVTPRRQSSGLLASLAGRVGSIIGQQSGSGGAGGGSGAGGGRQSGTSNPGTTGGAPTPSGAATPRSVASGPIQQLPPGTQVAGAAASGGPAGAAAAPATAGGPALSPGLGPLGRGLAHPPLPPPHPSILANVVIAAPPMSTRGRATYAGSRP